MTVVDEKPVMLTLTLTLIDVDGRDDKGAGGKGKERLELTLSGVSVFQEMDASDLVSDARDRVFFAIVGVKGGQYKADVKLVDEVVEK